MEWPNTKIKLLNRLKSYGSFTGEEALNRLYEAVLNAVANIRRGHDWHWKNKTASIATTAGTLGPYAAPSDFYKFAPVFRVYLYGYPDDEGVVSQPILETDDDQWDVIFRDQDGSLYFRRDPGGATFTLNYQAEFDDSVTEENVTAQVLPLPGQLYQVLADFVEADFMMESDDTRAAATAMEQKAFARLEVEWADYTKGRPKQRSRSPRGMDGRAFDGLGQQLSLGRPTYRRNFRRYS